MTIKETVRQALTRVRGNRKIFLFVIQEYAIMNDSANGQYTGEQFRRALRDLKHVKRINGRYIVKGRRVP